MENCCGGHRAKVSLLADVLLEGVLEVKETSGASNYGEVIVLLAVAIDLHPDNLPTVASVSKLTSISPSTVQRSLDKFIATGLLEKKMTSRGFAYDLTECSLVGAGFDCDIEERVNRVVEKLGLALTKMAKL